ncbi:hypothetical protein ThidrDRAFT_3719 [Thiorhodococcus drewsii AZ1]|uniref:Right handed beta helix domain-containing protein n=1 Tax=Thiorhodococcus drewsii AZ1 TaxID=765913 RepID=G2E606_9GAMM|nr:hypothetical protein ThidrDRAFT_3719 [Thiorhodococcus drewsii AZ1]
MWKWLKRSLRYYFVAVGLFAHLVLGALIARELTVYLSAATARESPLNTLTWNDVQPILPAWDPVPAGPLAPQPNTARIGPQTFQSLAEALPHLKACDQLDIGPGTYQTSLIIDPDFVRIVGHGEVVLERAAAKDKGLMLIRGNGVEVRNLECRHVSVRDGNGACIRLEGTGLLLDHVYFHDSQQGLLTGGKPGLVHIRNSRFERLGKAGRAHAIYMGGGRLLIENSLFLASKDQGHEIKTRASATTIARSVIASLTGNDSRLIDASNGGTLLIENSLLEQGPQTVNSTAIGFGLEGGAANRTDHRLTLKHNLIILERAGSNRFLHLGDQPVSLDISANTFIAREPTGYDDGNLRFESRDAAGMASYPALPYESFLDLASRGALRGAEP